MDAVPVPAKDLKERIESELDHHASQRWPDLEEITVTWRGSYGYLRAWTTVTEYVPVARIGYLGTPDLWDFAIYRASHEDYEPAVLPTGSSFGTAREALDCALGLYLADPTAWHTEPPKD